MSIQRRTVYYDDTGGIVRFWDWASVVTTLGVMVEPFIANARHAYDVDFEPYDPSDEVNRVDEIRAASVDKQQLILSGGDGHLHGGVQLPRTGR